jgi:hypothetical protein
LENAFLRKKEQWGVGVILLSDLSEVTLGIIDHCCHWLQGPVGKVHHGIFETTAAPVGCRDPLAKFTTGF